MTTTLTTSYVKLAVPGNKNGNDSHINRQENLLLLKLNLSYGVNVDGERIKVSNDWEDPFYEATYKIQSENGFSYSLLEDISDVMRRISQQVNEIPLKGSIILQHPALFNPNIICSKPNLQTESICFGNIWNNEFYIHWNVRFPPTNFRRSPSRDEVHIIKTHFDFDKNWPVTVTFSIYEQDDTNPSKTAKYQLSIEGSSIRHLIIDPIINLAPRRIYFILKDPVTVKKTVHKGGQPGNGSEKSTSRVLQLPSGINSEDLSHRKALTENKVFCMEFNQHTVDSTSLYTIISRLRSRWNIPVEIASITEFNGHGYVMERPHPNSCSPYRNTSYFCRNPCYYTEQDYQRFLKEIFPIRSQSTYRVADRINERKFAYTYLIEALFSRGAVVKDQLLLFPQRWYGFLQIIREHVNDDLSSVYESHNLCESALEDLLNHVDNQPRIGDLLSVFKRLCERRKESKESNQITTEEWDEGYRRVRKVIFTPTRKIYLAPEKIVANRAITGADHDGTRIIRTTFRDDNLGKMRYNLLRDLLKNYVLLRLHKGFCIMGRFFGYLASSNSQMRDGGAYFMERFNKRQLEELGKVGEEAPFIFKPKIISYRKKLGKFEYTGSIPKAMARLGQCFTQARACTGVEIGLQDYKMIPDAIGGKSLNGSPYMYTDGVGLISAELARQISKSMQLPRGFVPSAFQIRFRGLKGMLAVGPILDETTSYFKSIYRRGFMWKEVHEEIDLAQYTYKCLFRGSQFKFSSSTQGKEKWAIELVKWSSPTPVTLNRPLINILDQVSALQSLECHKRVCKRIEELLNIEMDSFSKCIVNEEKCRSKLEEMPRRVHFASLEHRFGFSLSTEPFFRSLIKASIDYSMIRLLKKVNIPIPSNVARSMFGITDESGQLQYGQIFVQCTENVNNKYPTKTSSSKILKGKVMVTKFPSMCEGDVRMYDAVDVPELRHLQNVIVFPQTGPRSMPDEMAGSDLDGDEYAVIWDPLLFFEKNEKAFAYCSEKPEEEFRAEEMDPKMIEFFAQFMEQEDVGVTATNHLHQSDQFGVTSDVCNILAKKHSMALDYSKSGVAPLPMTNKWTHNPETGTWEPPEKAERKPDYANRFGSVTMYTSSRLLGTLHRELRTVNDVVESSAEKQTPVVIDELLVWKGWERYKEKAEMQMMKYNGQLRSIMDAFGVNTEAEVFSGYYREIRNRQSDKENDSMSMYCTEAVIETQVTRLYKKFREEFFEEFVESRPDSPAYMQLTVPQNEKVWEENDILRRVCREPNDLMMAKAVAYYKTCYKSNIGKQDRKLSFAWIAYDILNCVRGKNLLRTSEVTFPRLPQYQAVCDHRNAFVSEGKNRGSFGLFTARLYRRDEGNRISEQESQAREIILKYTLNNLKLVMVLYIIDSWARVKGLLRDESDVNNCGDDIEKEKTICIASENSLKWYHLSLMVIMVATNQLGCLIDEDQKSCGSKVFDSITSSSNMQLNGRKLSDKDMDRLTLSFYRFLSTQEFRRLRYLNFASIGLKSVFMRGEWLVYHTAAVQTYYNLLLNLRFDELPVSTEPLSEKRSFIREAEPFFIEIPKSADYNLILERLRRTSKCVEIQARRIHQFGKEGPMLISCRGSVESINELLDLTSVKLPRYMWQSGMDGSHNSELSNALTHLLYYKVMGEEYQFQCSSVYTNQNRTPNGSTRHYNNRTKNRKNRQIRNRIF
uniref:RNA-directed RNA polymerase n=1 Tax=Caenorhabditis tropicalis TaxID=1561998 RepID=A0A1I7ULC3_9PELO